MEVLSKLRYCKQSLMTNLHRFDSSFPDGVDAYDGDPVAGDDAVGEVAVAVQLHVAGQLPLGNSVWTLLELQHLHTCTKQESGD